MYKQIYLFNIFNRILSDINIKSHLTDYLMVIYFLRDPYWQNVQPINILNSIFEKCPR